MPDRLGLSLLFALISIIPMAVLCCLIHYAAKVRRRLRERHQVEGKTGSTNGEADEEFLTESSRASLSSLASTPGMQEPCQVSAIVQTPEAVYFSNPFDKQQTRSESQEASMDLVQDHQL